MYQRQYFLKGITAGDIIPISLAAEYLKIDVPTVGSVDEELLQTFIDSAIDYFESYTLYDLRETTWETKRTDWAIEFLSKQPFNSLIDIRYLDENGDEQTVDASDYNLIPQNPYSVVLMKNKFSLYDQVPYPVTVNFKSGYSDVSLIPNVIISGLLKHIACLYENRGDCSGSQCASQNVPAQCLMMYDDYKMIEVI